MLFGLLKSPLVAKNPLYKKAYLNNVKKKIPGFSAKPGFVIVENTNFCNLSCVFCANEQMRRPRGFIQRQLFDKIVKDCASAGIDNLLIQGYGEPLLDSDYIDKARFAKDAGIKSVYCVTNGILLNETVAAGLVEGRLDYLCVSIDAASAATYSKIHKDHLSGRPSDKFDTVMRNVAGLAKARARGRSKKPFIQLRFKDFDLNRVDFRNFLKQYSSMADEVNVYMNITNWPGSSVKNNLPDSPPGIRFPCSNLWTTLFITYTGEAALCCQDYEARVIIGDANKEGIIDIWKGEKLGAIRRLHMAGEFAKVEVCRDCVINTHYVSPWW